MTLLEVCVESVADARAAIDAGAQRVELCAALSEGGLTPGAGALSEASEQLPRDSLVAMIRPRGGDALYDASEREVILSEIDACRALGADGIALGMLDEHGHVHAEFLRECVAAAGEMQVCFHRAFDHCADRDAALDVLIDCGVTRVLTSGGAANVPAGLDEIARLVQRAGEHLVIVPAGGVREHNIAEVLERTGAREIHVTADRERASKQPFPAGAPALGRAGAEADRVRRELDPQRVAAYLAAMGAK
ncbi:MAG: copper homeostasis protein CutC [Planctomycetota bacterium]|nr:MAG: copper homeostasis protein CutC [Planctomycetota bacterium]